MPTLNLSEQERRDLHHLIENERQNVAQDAGSSAEDYSGRLAHLLDKVEACA